MVIVREIDGKKYKFKLSSIEMYNAHKEFEIDSLCENIIKKYKYKKNISKHIAEDIYEYKAKGLSDTSAENRAIEDFKKFEKFYV